MPKSNIVKYTVEFDALEELSDDFVKRMIYEFFRSKVISISRGGLTQDAADRAKAPAMSDPVETWRCPRCDWVNPVEENGEYLNECQNCHVPILGDGV